MKARLALDRALGRLLKNNNGRFDDVIRGKNAVRSNFGASFGRPRHLVGIDWWRTAYAHSACRISNRAHSKNAQNRSPENADQDIIERFGRPRGGL